MIGGISMEETYCGKNCGECEHREAMNCPGCKAGPGSRCGDCELARCCMGKGHANCQTCIFTGNCGILRGCESMPDTRRRKQELEAVRRDELSEKAPLLGKWLWILFWMVIPQIIASIMTNTTVAEAVPGLQLPGTVQSTLCSLARGVILLQLAPINRRYKFAGWCGIVVAICNPIMSQMGDKLLLLIPAIPLLVVSFVAQYQEFYGHGEVLDGVDTDLAGKWRKLWNWYIGLFIAMFACIFLTILIPVIGMLGLIASLVGMIVVGITELVYLYRTANLFREYSAQLNN